MVNRPGVIEHGVRTKLDKLMADFTSIMRERFAADGEIRHLVWMLESADGHRYVVLMPCGDGDEKDAVADIMRHFLKVQHAQRYVMAAEVWSAVADDSPLPPRKRDTRKEAVLVTGEDIDGTTCGAFYEIERLEAGASLAPGQPFNDMGGRFTGLFAEA